MYTETTRRTRPAAARHRADDARDEARRALQESMNRREHPDAS